MTVGPGKVLLFGADQSGGKPPVAPEPSAPPRADGDPLVAFVDGAIAGDQHHLGMILQSAAPVVLTVVRVIIGRNHPDVPDVAQESLIALRDALAIFRRESTVLQYAKQVAVRTALSARRRWRARDLHLEALRRETTELPTAEAGHDMLVRVRRLAAFRVLLDELPDEQAETFALRVVLDYSLAQVATATGVPLNTVRSRVRLAKEKLRHRIENDPALREILTGGDQ